MGKVKNTSRGSVRLYKDPETKVAGRVNLWMEMCMDSLMGEGRDLSHIISEQRGASENGVHLRNLVQLEWLYTELRYRVVNN